MKELICSECGTQYKYSSQKKNGATPTLCNACQKRSASLKKKLKLLLIAGNGEANCRCCNYRKSPNALTLICGKGFLSDPPPEEKAKYSYVVCLNCESRIKAGEIEVQILDTKTTPIKIRFWETKVSIEEYETQDFIKSYSKDAIIMEVTNEKPKQERRVSTKIHRLEG